MFAIVKNPSRLVAFALAVGAWTPSIVGGQSPRPVVFVHGISSSGATWGMAPILEQQFYIRRIQPDLPSNGHVTYGGQAISLRAQLGVDTSDVIAVAHSNGGIVSRLARRNGMGFRAITTIGSPHQGAPLAANLLNGAVSAWASESIFRLTDPWFYDIRPNNQYVRFLLALHRSSSLTWKSAIELGRDTYMNSWAVVPQMAPGSVLLTDTLGTADIHGDPEALIQTRVSLRVSAPAPTTGIIFSGIAPNHRTAGIAGRTAMISVYTAWSVYFSINAGPISSYDRVKRLWTSQSMALAASSMLGWDRNWCRLIGTGVGAFNTNFRSCAPSDGIVPLANQYWSGANNVDVPALGHSAETTNLDIASQVGVLGLLGAGVSLR